MMSPRLISGSEAKAVEKLLNKWAMAEEGAKKTKLERQLCETCAKFRDRGISAEIFEMTLPDHGVFLGVQIAHYRYLTPTAFALMYANNPNKNQTHAPANAEFLLHLFLPDEICDPLVGDLEERFRKKAKRIGTVRARWWYRKQVLTSIWPLFVAAVKRASSSSVVNIFAFALRLLGQAAIAEVMQKALQGNLRTAGGRK